MCITFGDLVTEVNRFAPFRLQESYDNSGLLVGEYSTPLKGVLVCLDVTEEVLAEALDLGLNLILSHHPIIFSGIKSLCGDTRVSRIVMRALRTSVGILAAHTNLDVAYGGVSYALAEQLDLEVESVLAPRECDSRCGLGIIGSLRLQPMGVTEFLPYVASRLSQPNIRHSSYANEYIRRVAVCGGSGVSLLDAAIEAEVDAYITSDIKYHDFQSPEGRLLLMDVGHYESEYCAVSLLARLVNESFPKFVCKVSERERNPVEYFRGITIT